MMNRFCFAMMLCLLGICRPLSLHAEGRIPVIQSLIQQVSHPSVPVASAVLEEIAVISYQVLLDIPFAGVQTGQADIEGLITLKTTLTTHEGMLERLLALRMQEAIDCALLNEVNRRTMAFRGEPVTPPYQQDSLPDDTLLSLLDHNAMPEAEYARYILTREGTFTRFCQRKNIDADDILSGKAIRVFPHELDKQFMEVLSHFRALHEKMDQKTMQDFLFAYTFLMIDQARDVRILSEVFLTDPDFSLSIIDARKIEKVLASYPRYRRVRSGEKNRARWVFPVGSYCCTRPESSDYPILLTDLFDPYFKDIDAIAAQYEGIFSWYNESGARDLSEFETGMWLELDE